MTTTVDTSMTNSTKQATDVARAESTYRTTYIPRVDIWEGDEELLLFGDLPGVAPEDLDIRFENRELTIHGRVNNHGEGMEAVYCEYGVGDFHRTFVIGEAIDADKITAEMRGGVLKLRLPKSEKVKPRRIEVKAN